MSAVGLAFGSQSGFVVVVLVVEESFGVMGKVLVQGWRGRSEVRW